MRKRQGGSVFKSEKARAGARRAGLFLLLVAFLAGGLAIRVLKGPYADGPRMLGFRPTAEQPEPACVESQRVPAGSTLARLLDSQGVRPEVANEFLPRLSSLLDLRQVGPRDEVRLLSDRAGQLTRLEVHPGLPGQAGSVYVVSRDSTGYRTWSENEPLRRVYRKYEGSVQGTLSSSLKRAGILPAQIRQFCAIFGDEVDFAACRPGDRWTMLTEEFVDPDGHLARPGRVVGGRFVGGGVPHEAFYFDPDAEGAPTSRIATAALVTPPADEAADAGMMALPDSTEPPPARGLRGFMNTLLTRDSILPHEAEPPASDSNADPGEDLKPLPDLAALPGVAGLDSMELDSVALDSGAADSGARPVSVDRSAGKNGRSGKDGGYYRADGKSLRNSFLRAPLNYRRVSSGFTTRRLHPIFKIVRPHLGVDFAAAHGTPVKSVADGVVVSAGWRRGYGNLLRIRHRDGIITYSAHLSRFARGLRAGTAVKQGQVVGYVGSSGNSTGPHLDFRVERNGKFVDPLRFRPTGGEALASIDRALFDRQVRAYREALATLDAGEAMPSERFAVLLSAEFMAAVPAVPPAPRH